MRTVLMPSGVNRGSTSEDWAWSPIPIRTGSARAAVAADRRPATTATTATARLTMTRRLWLRGLDDRAERARDLDAIRLTDAQPGDQRGVALPGEQTLPHLRELHPHRGASTGTQ